MLASSVGGQPAYLSSAAFFRRLYRQSFARAWWQSALCCKLSAALDDSGSHILKLSLAQSTRHSTHRVYMSMNQYAGRFLHWHHSTVRCYCLLLLLSAALKTMHLTLSNFHSLRPLDTDTFHAHTLPPSANPPAAALPPIPPTILPDYEKKGRVQ